jgi:hypothetical protein
MKKWIKKQVRKALAELAEDGEPLMVRSIVVEELTVSKTLTTLPSSYLHIEGQAQSLSEFSGRYISVNREPMEPEGVQSIAMCDARYVRK